MLWNFLPRFNQRFGVAPAQPGSAYRQLTPGVSLDATLCFKYLRTVANDNTVRFNGATIQLLADDLRASYARAKVEVQERLDGHSSRTPRQDPGRRASPPRACHTQSSQRPPLQWPRYIHRSLHPLCTETQGRPTTKTKTGPPRKPAPNHPWRRPLLT